MSFISARISNTNGHRKGRSDNVLNNYAVLNNYVLNNYELKTGQ